MLNLILSGDTSALPLPPNYTYTVLKVGKAIVACAPTSFFPQTLTDPPEEEQLGRVFVFMRSKQAWIEIDLDSTPAGERIAQDIFVAYDQAMAELQDSRLDYQELY